MKTLLTTAAAFALLTAVATASEPARLTRVEAKPLGTGLDVVIQGEHLPQPRDMRILSNTSFILEFDAWLEGAPTRLPQTNGPAKFVEWGWYTNRPARVRVHVKLNNGATPVRFTKEEDGYHILVDLPTDSDELAKLRAAATPTAPAGMEGLLKPEETPIVAGDDRQPFRNLVTDLRNPVITDPAVIPSSTPPVSTPPVEEKNEETAPPVSTPPVEEKKEEATPPVTTPPTEEKKEETLPTLPPVSTPPVEEKKEEVTPPASTPPVRSAPVRTPRTTPTNTTTTNTTASLVQDAALMRKVSLDFVDTDVVQILKALAMQANVNIITSPEVSPSDKPMLLTLSLTNVTLEDSLSFITAMSGLRFARVASTFVVTPADKLSDTMRQILERNNNYQTRVVNLVSGEAKQIRDATLKANPQDGREGYYEIIVPENASATNMTAMPQNLIPPVEGQAAPQTPPTNPTMPQAAPANGRIYYLMIVGDADRLNAIETYVRGLDQNISNSFSLSRTEDIGTVAIPVQSGDPSKIQAMIQRLIAESPRSGDYSIQQTAISELVGSDAPSQVLLMVGPKTELGRLKTFAMALDQQLCEAVGIAYTADANGLGREYAILELRYLEPMVAEFDLKNRIRGLHVTIVPDPVTPGITGEDDGQKADDPATAQNQGGGAAGNGGGGTTTNRTSDLTRQIGHEPMRLIVRGTPDQIQQARNYLSLVDVAPRQVALELRVLELSKEDALKLGLDWGLLTGGRLISSRINMNPGVATDTPGAISGSYQGVGSFLGALDQLNDRNHLIARPNALVSDGRGTRLFVGDTIRYIKQIQASQSGTTVITDELEVGALFDIKARIGSEGNIALDLEQNFSILTSFLPVPGGGSLPQTSDRRTNMFVNMKSGETIAIGGLILEQDRSSVSGIPILKDLPIIGRLLFSRTNTSRERTEIVFFLTAKVVDETNRSDAASPRIAEGNMPDPMRTYRETGGNTGGTNP
ncbi:MAG: hypothetical protein KF812_00345 [Fimbriimonadaceae bacterium]|nr:hypothetical protein [Fimbriimonadaceae bacterium]